MLRISQPTLLRLGINLDALVASKIIAKERGAAAKLIYRIKTAVEGLSRDLQSARRTGKLAKTLVRSFPPSPRLARGSSAPARRRHAPLASSATHDPP